jgi:hypothetical protein
MQPRDARYVKLDSEYTKFLTWSTTLAILTCMAVFSERKPDLSSDFKIPGWRPVLKEDGEDPWILQDAKGVFYLRDAWDGRLFRVKPFWTEDPKLDTIEKRVDNIVCNLTWVEDDAERIFIPSN